MRWTLPITSLPIIRFFATAWWSVPADRHSQGCNLSFADVHVEHWRWAAPKPVTIPKIGATEIGGTADMKDFRRLQAGVRPETRFQMKMKILILLVSMPTATELLRLAV